MKKEVELRCRLCHLYRIGVQPFQKVAECPQCKTRWRLHWFDAETPLIVGPESWAEWERKVREEAK